MSKILRKLDHELSQRQQELASATSNVINICSDLTYLALTGTPAVATSGMTKERAAQAIAAVGEVTVHLQLVKKKIAEAESARKRLPKFLNGKQVVAIADMLNGKSIEVDALPFSLENADCSQLSSDAIQLSPRQLIASLTQVLRTASDTIAAITKRWEESESLIRRCEEELTAIEGAFADKLDTRVDGSTVRELITSGRTQVESWRATWQTDPLGTGVSLEAIVKIRSRIEESERQRLAGEKEIADARAEAALLDKLSIGERHTKISLGIRKVGDIIRSSQYSQSHPAAELHIHRCELALRDALWALSEKDARRQIEVAESELRLAMKSAETVKAEQEAFVRSVYKNRGSYGGGGVKVYI